MEIIKVSSKSVPQKVAGAIANILRDKDDSLELQAVGAGALNQSIKGIIIARGFLAPLGKEISIVPAFSDIVINGEERTAIKLMVEAK